MTKNLAWIQFSITMRHLLSFNTDTKNTENSKEQFKHHKQWILAYFSHLIPVYLVQKNGGKNSKKRHLCDLAGS